ncbi:MAG: alpha/beta fold hydrolase [Bacteroidota bacterium]
MRVTNDERRATNGTAVAEAPVLRDPETVDLAYPPDLFSFTVESAGERLLGCIYVADGPGPHPTVLLLHGCPGNERNFDLAQALRRCGFNVATMHYRGSWGSGGAFSITGALEDVPATLAFLRQPETAAAFRIDTTRLIPVGHSMGGFAALIAAAADERVPAVAALAAFNFGLHARLMERVPEVRARTVAALGPLVPPLRGATAEGLTEEMAANQGAWDLLDRVPALASRPLLLVGAARDDLAIPSLHHRPLAEAFGDAGTAALAETTFDDDHVFSSHRIALAQVVASWLGAVTAEP